MDPLDILTFFSTIFFPSVQHTNVTLKITLRSDRDIGHGCLVLYSSFLPLPFILRVFSQPTLRHICLVLYSFFLPFSFYSRVTCPLSSFLTSPFYSPGFLPTNSMTHMSCVVFFLPSLFLLFSCHYKKRVYIIPSPTFL